MTRAEKIKVAKTITLNLLVVACLCVLSFANVDGLISPFAFAFLFATFYLPTNKVLYGLTAFLCSLFVSYGRLDVLSASFSTAVFFAMVWSIPRLRAQHDHKKWWHKLRFEYVLIFVFYILSNALNIYFAHGNLLTLYLALIELLIGIIFLSCALIFVVALFTRGNKIPWTIDQKICAGVFFIAVALGLSAIESPNFNVHKFVTVLVILCATIALDGKTALVLGLCMGLGASFAGLDTIPVATCAMLALACVAFKTTSRYTSIVAVMAVDFVIGFYFRAYIGYDLFDLLPLVIACGIAGILPPKLVKYFNVQGHFLSGHLVSKNTINKNRQGIYKRMENLALVFNEMQNIYKNLVTGCAPPDEVARMISSDLSSSVCANCENKPNCRRDTSASASVDISLERLVHVALKRGNVTILDISPDLTMRCTKLNAVIAKTNALIANVNARNHETKNLDASKVLMAGLLSGMSKLCKTFATDMCGSVMFDVSRAMQIKDALLRAGIVASDCLLTGNGRGEYAVSVLVSRTDSHNTGIERVVSSVCGHKMLVDSIDDAETAGFAIVTVKTAPRYSVTFGVAQVSKNFNPTCGDTFTVLKISHNQTMMAICDGMGAGEKAHRASILALSLVENFYRAGFPNEVIMESVNQLLILTEQEVFSAIDIAVFSLADGMVNFIKVGGVEGFIKRDREIEIVEAGSLPIGIVEEMTPKITRAHLVSGDKVVLASDGILESFGDRAHLANFINNIGEKTAQQTADEIIAEALRRTDKIAVDDCTVVVAHIANS